MYGTVYHIQLCFLSRPSIVLNPEKVRYGFSYYLSFIYPNGERSHLLFTHVDSHLSPLLLEEGGEPFFCCCLISDLITTWVYCAWCCGSVTFGMDLDPRIRTTDLRIRILIRILLFSSVADEMPTKI
jgi:hypothetical protein